MLHSRFSSLALAICGLIRKNGCHAIAAENL
jgi:hypothetical protein